MKKEYVIFPKGVLPFVAGVTDAAHTAPVELRPDPAKLERRAMLRMKVESRALVAVRENIERFRERKQRLPRTAKELFSVDQYFRRQQRIGKSASSTFKQLGYEWGGRNTYGKNTLPYFWDTDDGTIRTISAVEGFRERRGRVPTAGEFSVDLMPEYSAYQARHRGFTATESMRTTGYEPHRLWSHMPVFRDTDIGTIMAIASLERIKAQHGGEIPKSLLFSGRRLISNHCSHMERHYGVGPVEYVAGMGYKVHERGVRKEHEEFFSSDEAKIEASSEAKKYLKEGGRASVSSIMREVRPVRVFVNWQVRLRGCTPTQGMRDLGIRV
jgi:hypothetical protein